MNTSKDCVTNPVPAKTVVSVKPLEWGLLTPPDCTNLIPTLQAILDALNALQDLNVDLVCLNPDTNNLSGILNTIINKLCVLESNESEEIEDTILNIDLNLCQGASFDCNTNSCIEVETCNSEPTLEEKLQAMTSRIVSLSDLVKQQCTLIEDLQDQITVLENNEDCCDTSNLQAQINNLQSQITSLNNNCC